MELSLFIGIVVGFWLGALLISPVFQNRRRSGEWAIVEAWEIGKRTAADLREIGQVDRAGKWLDDVVLSCFRTENPQAARDEIEKAARNILASLDDSDKSHLDYVRLRRITEADRLNEQRRAGQ